MIYCEECGRVYDKMEECTFHSVVIKTIQYSLPDLEKGIMKWKFFVHVIFVQKDIKSKYGDL